MTGRGDQRPGRSLWNAGDLAVAADALAPAAVAPTTPWVPALPNGT